MPSNKRITRIEMLPTSVLPPSIRIKATWIIDATNEVGVTLALMPETDLGAPAAVHDALIAEDADLNFAL